VAVERSWRPKGSDEWKRETDWINVVGWSLSDYVRGGLTKGACVLVKGSIRTDSYEAKDGSGKRYNTYVHADKVQLFKPGLFTGDTLYLDLDIIIEGDLHRMVKLLDHGDFWALDDFAWPLSHSAEIDAIMRDHPHGAELRTLIGGPGTCNSSVMLWRDEAGRDIWEQYSLARISGLAGDQNWITQCMGDRLHLIPPGWARSYRYGGKGPITVFHGSPKPHEVATAAWH
jgi:hypothetical protein